MRQRELDRIRHLEASGVLGDLRREVRYWDRRNPRRSYIDAMRDLRVPAYLVGVVDGALTDERARTRAHSAVPQSGTAYTLTSLPADLESPDDYPAEAVCGARCGQPVRCESIGAGWRHFERGSADGLLSDTPEVRR